MNKFARVISVVLLLLILQTGCSKVNHENYELLEAGMSYKEVVEILGGPDECSQVMGVKSCTWGDEKRHIRVGFMGDLVVIFSASGLK